MNTVEILKAARELIASPDKWITGDLARDAGGCEVTPNDDDAVCWCAEGAIQKASPTWGTYDGLRTLLNEIAGESLFRFNDSHTHSEVIALFDRAIEKAQS